MEEEERVLCANSSLLCQRIDSPSDQHSATHNNTEKFNTTGQTPIL